MAPVSLVATVLLLVAVVDARCDDMCMCHSIKCTDTGAVSWRLDVQHNTSPDQATVPKIQFAHGNRHAITNLGNVSQLFQQLVPFAHNGFELYDYDGCNYELIQVATGQSCVHFNKHTSELLCDTNPSNGTRAYFSVGPARLDWIMFVHTTLRTLCDGRDRDVFFISASSSGALDAQLACYVNNPGYYENPLSSALSSPVSSVDMNVLASVIESIFMHPCQPPSGPRVPPPP
ncbi:Uncharacterized protein PBTT_08046 [Plasmodiophora brassicae]